MAIVEEHVSPDGLLRLIVDVAPDGDVMVGLAGYEWHTHADLLAAALGLAEDAAVRRYVDDVLGDRTAIALFRDVAGEILDAWVADDPARDAAYPTEGEAIELRYWSGRPWAAT